MRRFFFENQCRECRSETTGEQANTMKASRNALCSCGSGKKYKKCCIDNKKEIAQQLPQRLKEQAAPEATPSHIDIEKLVALFKERQYEQAASIAQMMIDCFPTFGIGWKALGAAYSQMGREADALSPMKTAADLLPDDAEVHNNLGVVYKGLGYFDNAIASYHRALSLRPNYYQAFNNLGNAQHKIRQYDAAVECYRQALRINPEYAEAHSNLCITLTELARPDEAFRSGVRALEINPNFPEAHNNLGNALQELGRLDDAVACYRRALEIKHDYAEACMNLGNAYRALGRLHDAVIAYRRALEINKRLGRAYLYLGHTLLDLDNLNQASVAYQNAMNTEPEKSGLVAAVNLAVLDYINGDDERCRYNINASQLIIGQLGIEHKNARIYREYLDKLLSTGHRRGASYDLNRENRILYVVGESHALSAHGAVVNCRQEKMQCLAEWIPGCKQWHLGNEFANRYKQKFEAVMRRLPMSSIVLLTIGEIDCRPDEGIIKAWKKKNEKSLESLIEETVRAYVRFVISTAHLNNHFVIICGVPASNIDMNSMTADEQRLLIHLIKSFNLILKECSLSSGLGFLDVYALTDRGDGRASGRWHIDCRHLLPDAVVEAFDKYYYVRPSLPA